MYQEIKTTTNQPYGSTVKPLNMTINEQVKEIMKKVNGKANQDAALIKLGLRPADIQVIRFMERQERKASRRMRPVFSIGNITFGVEIECVNAPHARLVDAVSAKGIGIAFEGYNHTDRKDRFKLVTDASLCGSNPIECVSPVLKGKDGENQLKTVCDTLAEVGATANRSCGLHVHIGADKMTDEQYIRVFKNYQAIEGLIDTMMPESRRGNCRWAKSLVGRDFSRCTTKSQLRYEMNNDRYYKVNAISFLRHQTIEFRQHSGTVEFKKIKMWVRFLAAFVQYSMNNDQPAVSSVEELTWLPKEVVNFYKARIAALA